MKKTISDLFESRQSIESRMVGWLLSVEQDPMQIIATMVSHDSLKVRVGGIPAYCFLLAYPQTNNTKKGAILLLRLISSTTLKQDLVSQTLLQLYQTSPKAHSNLLGEVIEGDDQGKNLRLDQHTQDFLSYGGYKCEVLGSIYEDHQGNVAFGADIEYSPNACMYTVTKPTDTLLSCVLDIVKSSRTSSNSKMMDDLGFKLENGKKPNFKIGSLRYSATRNLQNPDDLKKAEICFNYDEVISKRVAVFGMTRTGKSNMIKKMITSLHVGALQRNIKFGQLIFDINGEYANSNNQDEGSIADVFGDLAVRYCPGVKHLKNKQIKEMCPDFYTDLQFGITLIQKKINKDGGAISEAFKGFMDLRFLSNHGDDEALKELRKFLYRALLYKAGYDYNKKKMIHHFPNLSLFKNENKSGFDLSLAKANGSSKVASSFISIKDWSNAVQGEAKLFENLHPEIKNLICLINGKGTTGHPITGLSYIAASINQHSPNNHISEIKKTDEMLDNLRSGKLVIIDLSHNSPSEQIALMDEYAKSIFMDYSSSFRELESKNPPCLIYIEEAHNMLGTDSKDDDIWPRIAKEGAKFGLGLVYATQQPSSIQTGILSNTENFIVCHLNNQREVREICGYFDFQSYFGSIIKIQEPGFVRIKQHDMPFVIPVQIDKFNVENSKIEIQNALLKSNVAFEDDIKNDNIQSELDSVERSNRDADIIKNTKKNKEKIKSGRFSRKRGGQSDAT